MYPTPPDFDGQQFRNTLSQFATGVTVITTRVASHSATDNQPELIGFTANSFNSVSLAPPLVLWSLSLKSSSLAIFRENKHYAINVLASDQIHLSHRFAATCRERFAGVEFRLGLSGVPILEGCCAWFECFNRSRYEEGDHVIFVGEVERCGFQVREPLIFQNGDYHTAQRITTL